MADLLIGGHTIKEALIFLRHQRTLIPTSSRDPELDLVLVLRSNIKILNMKAVPAITRGLTNYIPYRRAL
jgi:hypothetical protein